MVRQLTALLGAAIVGLLAAASTSAARAEQVHILIDDHFQSEPLSEQCGVDVFIDVVADLHVTLVYNREGLIVRELDRAPGSRTITYRSPDTGNSFSFSFTSSQWDYGAGAVVGSPASVSFTGLAGHIPGLIDSEAGLVRVLGTVAGFDQFGVPHVDFQQVIADHGNRNSDAEIAAAICAALTDP